MSPCKCLVFSVPGERTRPWALLGFLMPLAAGALVSMAEAAARPALAAFALCCISLVATSLLGAGELNLASGGIPVSMSIHTFCGYTSRSGGNRCNVESSLIHQRQALPCLTVQSHSSLPLVATSN